VETLPVQHLFEMMLLPCMEQQWFMDSLEGYCAELIDEFREIPGINGVHLMAPRNLAAIAPTVARTGIKI